MKHQLLCISLKRVKNTKKLSRFSISPGLRHSLPSSAAGTGNRPKSLEFFSRFDSRICLAADADHEIEPFPVPGQLVELVMAAQLNPEGEHAAGRRAPDRWCLAQLGMGNASQTLQRTWVFGGNRSGNCPDSAGADRTCCASLMEPLHHIS
jgi:hypothetical protein